MAMSALLWRIGAPKIVQVGHPILRGEALKVEPSRIGSQEVQSMMNSFAFLIWQHLFKE